MRLFGLSGIAFKLSVLLVLSMFVMTTMVACGGAAKVPGKWQAANNPDAGFDIRSDGTFQGELGPSGDRRVRLNGKWEAKGADVTFTLEPGPLQGLGPLMGKIDGDTMTLTSPQQGPGNVTLKRRTN